MDKTGLLDNAVYQAVLEAKEETYGELEKGLFLRCDKCRKEVSIRKCMVVRRGSRGIVLCNSCYRKLRERGFIIETILKDRNPIRKYRSLVNYLKNTEKKKRELVLKKAEALISLHLRLEGVNKVWEKYLQKRKSLGKLN